MPGPILARSLTVRLHPDIYEAAATVARKRRTSLNALVQDGLAQIVREEDDRELFEAFERYGVDADSDVSYALGAQSEIALGVEYDAS